MFKAVTGHKYRVAKPLFTIENTERKSPATLFAAELPDVR